MTISQPEGAHQTRNCAPVARTKVESRNGGQSERGTRMLMVLMALVSLGRMKIHAATRWLWLALSGGMFVAAPLGCERKCECECACECPAPGPSAASACPEPEGELSFAPTPAPAPVPDPVPDPEGELSFAPTPAPSEKPSQPKIRPPKKVAPPAVKPPEPTPIPDVPQTAYGPPPTWEREPIMQPMYGAPINDFRKE